MLCDYYLFPESPYWAVGTELSIAVIGGLFFNYTQISMGKCNGKIRSPIAQIITRRWYSYFFAWCVVCNWKGMLQYLQTRIL